MSARLIPARAFGQAIGFLTEIKPGEIQCPYCGEPNYPIAVATPIDCRGCGLPFNPSVAFQDFEEGTYDDPNQTTMNLCTTSSD